MSWPPWHHRHDRGKHWHDLIRPEPTINAGELAADMRDEIQRLADIGNEPTAVYRTIRVPPWLTFTEDEDDEPTATGRPTADRVAANQPPPGRRPPMPTRVRIVIITDDQIRSYDPSPQELHNFIPTGQLIAHVRKSDDGGGYRVYHADTETTGTHSTYAEAIVAALRLS